MRWFYHFRCFTTTMSFQVIQCVTPCFLICDYRRFGVARYLFSILKPLKLTNSLQQPSDVWNYQKYLITGPGLKSVPDAFCSVDKMNKHRQTWQGLLQKRQKAMPKRAKHCGWKVLKRSNVIFKDCCLLDCDVMYIPINVEGYVASIPTTSSLQHVDCRICVSMYWTGGWGDWVNWNEVLIKLCAVF
jgi:hypothetical protein